LSLSELPKVPTIQMDVFLESDGNRLGRETGQTLRLRTVTADRLLVAIVSALAASRVESLADLLRTYNHQQGVSVAYKAYYNLHRFSRRAQERQGQHGTFAWGHF